MEKLIKQFLKIDGYGNGYGNGDGYGDGNGYGNGDGYGDGYGNGYGDGDGDGDGNGDGDGDGDGDGNGDGDGIILHSFRNKNVYYIDKIPCTFDSIKGNAALVSVINVADFSDSKMYVAKRGNLFAHGNTLKEAHESVELKYYSTIGRDKAIAEFKNQFKAGIEYSNNLFYKWHTILTGSCESGKNHWLKENGININGSMTVAQFIEKTKNAYGSDIIRSLINNS